jgi:protein-S-isoprenylcysteine O-methyltransferase Ste14
MNSPDKKSQGSTSDLIALCITSSIGFMVFGNYLTVLESILSYAIIYIGILLIASGHLMLKLSHTTFQAETPATLVTNGPYIYTRNPIYLGMLLLLVGASIHKGNMLRWLVPVAFYYYIDTYIIPLEEDILKVQFKEDFLKYSQVVRRWV